MFRARVVGGETKTERVRAEVEKKERTIILIEGPLGDTVTERERENIGNEWREREKNRERVRQRERKSEMER